MASATNVARAACFFAAFVLAASAFAQSTFTLSQLNRPSGAGGPEINEFISNPTAPMVRSISDPPWGSASSFGEAEFGVLKASATANATGETFGRFFARSGAGFTDDFTFNSTGMNGESGFMILTLDFQRLLGHTGNAVDSYATDTLHAGTNFWSFDYFETLMLQPSGCSPYSPPGPCTLTLTTQTLNGADSATWLSATAVSLRVPITFGVANSFSVSIDVTALATWYTPQAGDGSSTWTADAAHSLYWGGITSVTDADGHVVAFDLSTASGTDYLQSFIPTPPPVPEPESYAFMLAGLGVLGLVRRHGTAKR